MLFAAVATADPARRDDWQIYTSARSFGEMVVWGQEIAAAADDAGVRVLDPGSSVIRSYRTLEGLGSNRATALLADDAGTLWVGTGDAGLTRIFPDGSTRAIVGLIGQDVQALARDGSFIVYGTPVGAGPIVDGIPGLPFTVDDGLISDNVQALAARDGMVWFGTDAGVTLFDRVQNVFISFLDGLATTQERNVLAILAEADGVIIGTEAGPFAFDDSDSSWVALGSGLSTGVGKLLRRSNGDLFAVGTNFRAYGLAAGSSDWLNLGLHESTRDVRCAVERGGMLWLGGSQRSVGPAQGDPQAYLLQPDSGEKHVVRGLFGGQARGSDFDGEGGFWIGGFPTLGGLNHVDSNGIIHPYGYILNLGSPVGLCAEGPKLSVLRSSTGDIWATSFQACVDRVRPAANDDPTAAEYLGFSDKTLLKSRRVTRIYEDPRGRIWFLSDGFAENDGIDILLDPSNPLDEASWLKVDPSNSLLAGDGVFGLAFGSAGRVWLAIDGVGLQRWDTDGLLDDGSISTMNVANWWQEIKPADIGGVVDFADPRTLALHPDGSLWVVALGEGVLRIDLGTLQTELFAQSSFGAGMLSNAVRDLTIDRRGDVWVASDAGLNRIRGIGFEAEIDSWTDRILFESRSLGTRGYLPSVISPLPGSNLWSLNYDPASDVLLVGGSAGAARIELAESEVGAAELDFRLYPNPVRPGSTGAFADRFDGIATVRVYDLQGQLIVERSGYEAGDGPFWDLRTLRDENVASGLYLVQLEVGGLRREAILAVER